MKGCGFDGRRGFFGGSEWDWDPVVKARLRHDQSGEDEDDEGGNEKAEAAAVHAKGEHCDCGGHEQMEQMPDARMKMTLKALLLFCRAELLPFGISLYFHYERVGKNKLSLLMSTFSRKVVAVVA